eukprot:scaffold6843_cov148-Ochromonas_danica.AAC.1
MKDHHEVRESFRTDISSNFSQADIDDAFYATYAPDKLLGYGSSANVVAAHHKQSGKLYACK